MTGRGRGVVVALWIALIGFGAFVPPGAAEAAAISEAYLFSDWNSTPPNNTALPFTMTSTDGVRLTLDSSGLATGQTDIGALSFFFQTPLTYVSHTGSIDAGEPAPSGIADLVNSEIRALDDAGLVLEGTTDAPMNADFGDGTRLILAIPPGGPGWDRLIIVDDAGLDPFKLEFCADATCSSPALLFSGFSSGVKTQILGRADFGGDDSSPDIDQAYIFIFDQPLGAGPGGGFFRITETTNYGGTYLEIDVAAGTPVAEPITVAEPGTFLLLCAGLAGMGARARRRKAPAPKHRVRRGAIAAAFGLALAGAGTGSAEAAVVKLSLSELVAGADLIIHGRVTEVRAEAGERGAIWTIATAGVVRILKGQAGASVTVRVFGGTLNGRTLRVAEMPEFRTGEESVLFLKRGASSPHHEVVGAFQGKKGIEGGQVVPEKTPVGEFLEKIRRLTGN